MVKIGPGSMEAASFALKHTFGFTEFRPNQEQIIEGILSNRDILAIMPTGGGKSLCYQIPSKVLPGLTIVISPLISLMKDQVDAASANGIEAACLNSSMTPGARRQVHRRLELGKLEMLYLAPERLAIGGFLEQLGQMHPALFAIDEAHCLSEWGHDFRPDYLQLANIRKSFPDVPIAAFTATATDRVQSDILKRLGLKDPLIVRASFDRPNLFLDVQRKSDADQQVIDFAKSRKGQSGIVYRTTRRSVESTARAISAAGISALPYHAGLPDTTRKTNQELFKADQVNVVVATIAFGMGIDKPNVRYVIHADLPKNIEGYYQEIGRAGRDGDPAHCLLLFNRSDRQKLLYLLKDTSSLEERNTALDNLESIISYATTHKCRRAQVLAYFGEDLPHDNCGTCDVCTSDVKKVDATVNARILLSAVARTNQRFGARHVIGIVVGANTKKIRDFGHDLLPTYGLGRDLKRPYWERLLDQLLADKALQQSGGRFPVLGFTDHGAQILKGDMEFLLTESPDDHPAPSKTGISRQTTFTSADDQEPYDEELFEKLRTLRTKLAREQHIAPFLVFPNRTLRNICRSRPTSMPEMREVSGIGEAKLARYGQAFLDVTNSAISQ